MSAELLGVLNWLGGFAVGDYFHCFVSLESTLGFNGPFGASTFDFCECLLSKEVAAEFAGYSQI